MAETQGPRKKVQAMRVSGYVLGPCSACTKAQRALVMFDDYAWGVECLGCGHIEHVDEVEYVPEGNVEY
jgi:hypothetical protein